MDQTHDYEIACERYLLGELSEQEQTQLEAQYFEDDALFERFLAVKDDLLDAYARGQLRAEKRQGFERHFLATQPRRLRAEEARQFINAINAVSGPSPQAASTESPARSSSWWQSISERVGLPPLVFQGVLAGLITVSLIGGWFWWRNLQNRRAEQARAINEERQGSPQPLEQSSSSPSAADTDVDKTTTPAEPGASVTARPSPTSNRQPTQPAPAQVASLTLIPFAPRDGSSSNTLHLARDTRTVRLHLTFKGDEYRSHTVTLRTLEGQRVMQSRALKAVSEASGKSLTLTVDPAILIRQDYILTLNGMSDAGQSDALAEYYFRVERRPSQ